MLPNVYTCYTMYIPIYIVYIHCVTFAYTLCCKPYTLCYIFLSHNVYTRTCYTMYMRPNALQCIYTMYIKCNTMYIPPHTLTTRQKGAIYIVLHFIYIVLHFYIRCRWASGNMVPIYIVVHSQYTLCNMFIYIVYIHCVTFFLCIYIV